MQEETQALCAANSYIRKFYLDPAFAKLPEAVKQELQIICVQFTEDVGGVLLMYFDAAGSLKLKVMADDGDYLFDEVGSGLKVKQLLDKHAELFKKLEAFYALLVKGGDVAAYVQAQTERQADGSCGTN